MQLSASASPAGPQHTVSIPFVGREREFAQLKATVHSVLAGRGQVALLVGEPGIGKTRLATEVAAAADSQGLRVLWGRCYEWEGAPAYWPWIQVLRSLLDSVSDEVLIANLAGAGSDIAQIVPEIRDRFPHLPELPTMEPEQARFRMFDALATSLRALARTTPLLIVLDDLHWADQPSQLLLQFLTQELTAARVLLLTTLRDVEVQDQHPLTGILAELSRHPQVTRLNLRGLSPTDIARFVEQMTQQASSVELVEAIFSETEGNPFFTAEVVRLLLAEGRLPSTDGVSLGVIQVPETVREAVVRRLQRLTGECNRILSVGAVIGREFTLPLLATVSQQSSTAVLPAIDEALHARLIEQTGPVAFRFTHALVHDTVYESLPTLQRLQLHRRVGEQLEQLHATDLELIYPDLAHHFVQAIPIDLADTATTYAIKAAESAERRLAWESAIEQYERALQLWDSRTTPDERLRCEVMLALGEAESRAGTGAGLVIGAGNSLKATETFMAAARVARAAGLAEQLARAAHGIVGPSLSVAQGFNEASELMEEALTELPPIDSELRARLLAGWAAHRCSLLSLDKLPDDARLYAKVRTAADAAVAMARRLDDPATLAYTLHARVHVGFGPANPNQSLVDARETVVAAEASGDQRLHFLSLFDVYNASLYQGNIPLANEVAHRLQHLAMPLKIRYFDYAAGLTRIGGALRSGRFTDAADAAEHVLSVVWPRGGIATWQLYAALREQRRVADVADGVEWIYRQGPTVAMWRALRIRSLLDLGDTDSARALYETIPSRQLQKPPPIWTTRLFALYAEFAVAFDDRELATLIYPKLLPYADQTVFALTSDHCVQSAAYSLGVLAHLLGHRDDAEVHFAAALRADERRGIRPAAAWTRYAWAVMLDQLAGATERDRAAELATTALHDAESMGMTLLADQARPLVAVLDAERPRRTMAADGTELSPRERDVLRLIVDGQTDREIADQLFISPRTVSTHVSNILNKLSVASRTEAAAAALRRGLF